MFENENFFILDQKNDRLDRKDWKNSFAYKIENWSDQICSSIGQDKYWSNLTQNFDEISKIYIISDHSKQDFMALKNITPIGFALVKENYYCQLDSNKKLCFQNSNKHWYVELICSQKGYGQKLLQWIIDQAKENENVQYISLSSLKNVLGFYYKLGFELGFHNTARNNKQLLQLSNDLKNFLNETKNYESKEFFAFLEKAIPFNLGNNCSTNPDISCLDDGLYMTLFLKTNQAVINTGIGSLLLDVDQIPFEHFTLNGTTLSNNLKKRKRFDFNDDDDDTMIAKQFFSPIQKKNKTGDSS